jgi:hypothetical protein
METPAQIKLTQPRGTTLIDMGVAALILAGLYFGREIFVPVALSVLHRDYLKAAPLEDYYDTVLAGGPGLALADNRLGHLDAERLDRITATVRELVDDLDGHEDVQVVEAKLDSPLAAFVDAGSDEDETRAPRVWQAPRSILCIPGFSKLDEAAAIVLAQLLRRRGYGASAEQSDAMSVAKFFSLDLTETAFVCICYADRPSSAKLHYAVRGLTKKTKSAYAMALFLGPAAEELEKVPGLSATTKTFAAALEAVEQKAGEARLVSEVAADVVRVAPSAAG